MKRSSRDARTVLVCTVVAHLSDRYSRRTEEGYRGNNWTPDSMQDIISSEIEKQAQLHEFSRTIQKDMVRCGLLFYKSYFDRTMREIFELQQNKPKTKRKIKK